MAGLKVPSSGEQSYSVIRGQPVMRPEQWFDMGGTGANFNRYNVGGAGIIPQLGGGGDNGDSNDKKAQDQTQQALTAYQQRLADLNAQIGQTGYLNYLQSPSQVNWGGGGLLGQGPTAGGLLDVYGPWTALQGAQV